MSDEHGEGFFGSEIKKSQRMVIEKALSDAYVDGRRSTERENVLPKPADYAKKKMAELEKKMGGRPW